MSDSDRREFLKDTAVAAGLLILAPVAASCGGSKGQQVESSAASESEGIPAVPTERPMDWDAIDFKGLFGLPMSIRLNLLGRDSILAAPLVLDLARWTAVLQMAGRCGPVPELGFYFKKAVGDSPPVTFQDQVTSLAKLANECEEKISA